MDNKMLEAGAIIAGAIIGSLITVLGTWSVQSRIEKKRLYYERLQKQFSEFYDPLFVLLSINKNIFTKFGPYARKGESNLLESEHLRIWNSLLDSVINKNNEKILHIIEKNLHFVDKNDKIDHYLDLSTHIIAYKEFQQQPFEGYKENFSFPRDIINIIANQREDIKKRQK